MAAAMKSYEVSYQRDETGWWVASIPTVQGCHTQGRTIEEARRRIREALSLFADDADRAELVDRVRLPAGARQAVQRFRRQRERLEQVQADQRAAMEDAARALVEEVGLSVRDAGQLLGLSFQRVQQLSAQPRVGKGRRAAAK
jgi:predicted RNase H-like HicB family nuclease